MRAIFSILLAGATASCVPLQLTYFVPSASAGKVYAPRNSCVADVILFESPEPPHPGLTMEMDSLPGDRSAKLIAIMTGSASLDVRAVSDSVAISWAGGGRQIAKPDFIGPDHRLIFPGRYYFIDVPDYSGDWIEVEMPSMTVDGHRLDIPKVRFIRVTQVELCPVNG